MKVIKSPEVLMFETWEREADYRTKIVVLRDTAGAVTLIAKMPYGDKSFSVEMSAVEAGQLGEEVAKLVPAGGAGRSISRDYAARKLLHTNRVDEASGMTVIVAGTNQGEPYQDGIRVEICPTGCYGEGISVEFGFYEAAQFAAGLAVKA